MTDSAAREASWSTPAFDLTAGELCLDFANTLNSGVALAGEDKLRSYSDLLAWGVQASAVSSACADRLQEQADHAPDKAAKVLGEAQRVRESIYRLFAAASAGRPSRSKDLPVLNPALRKALPHVRIRACEDGYEWGWSDADVLDRVLWPIVGSAAQLLTGNSRDLVGECQARDCTWLFMDTSRNKRRRWCDMKSCGNREKARRHYEKRSRQSD